MPDALGQLVCFDEATRDAVDAHLDWDDVENGKHKGCGNPDAVERDHSEGHDVKAQQRIYDDGLHRKFLPPAEVDGAFRVKRLSRPWAEGEVLGIVNRAGGSPRR